MTSRLRESAGRRLVDAIVLPLERLRRVVDDQLPLGSSEEAVDYVLAHASGFSVASVLEYCGAD